MQKIGEIPLKVDYMISVGDPTQFDEKFIRHDGFMQGLKSKRLLFAGRSNAGKSSFINALTRSKISHVSKEPGKTRKLNFFHVPEYDRIICDMPGYGFAKRSAKELQLWRELIDTYMTLDQKNVETVYLISDSRHGPNPADVDALLFFLGFGVNVTLVMNKIDRLNQKEMSARRKHLKEVMLKYPEFKEQFKEQFNILWVSCTKDDGVHQLRRSYLGL